MIVVFSGMVHLLSCELRSVSFPFNILASLAFSQVTQKLIKIPKYLVEKKGKIIAIKKHGTHCFI